jgi:hypothetical protein
MITFNGGPNRISIIVGYFIWLIQKFQFPELPELRKLYPHGYHKVDKQVGFYLKVVSTNLHRKGWIY